MKNPIPEIRIKDAWLLRKAASVPLNELWGDGGSLRTDEEYAAITETYQKAWKPFEQKILGAITDILGFFFRQNTIDVYIAPWFNAFSDPMVIGVVRKPDVFVDTLTHELIHRLLTDNTAVPHELFLLPVWEELFGKNHAFNTLVHIPVHAVQKAIYLDVLNKPKHLERDVTSCKDNKATDYIAAWDYVDKHGYLEIIEKLRASYKKLQAEQ